MALWLRLVFHPPNHHFANLATNLGHYHQFVEENYDEIDLREARTRAMDHVASKYY